MKNILATTTLAAVMTAGVIGSGMATPLTGTFATTVYTFEDPNYQNENHPGLSTDATEQSLPGAQATGKHLATSRFTYTGALNFALGSGGTNSVAAFIASGGGTVSGGTVPNTTLSSGTFDQTSLFKFTFTTASAIAGTITHDDGVSLFVSGNTTNDLLPVSASAPTTASLSSFSIGPGSYDLYYTEANGLPAQLNFNVVPEPASLMLVGAGLVGLGLFGRRRRAANPAA